MKLTGGYFSTIEEVEKLAEKYKKGKKNKEAYIYERDGLYYWSSKKLEGNIIKII